MRWTRAALKTRALNLRTEKSCGPDASTLASSSRKQVFAGDGDKKARSPGRVRRKPLKPLLRGCRVIFGATAVNTRVHLALPLRTRGCGCTGHPAFPTPSLGGGRFTQSFGRNPRRESSTHVSKPSLRAQRSNPSCNKREVGLLRCARNDGLKDLAWLIENRIGKCIRPYASLLRHAAARRSAPRKNPAACTAGLLSRTLSSLSAPGSPAAAAPRCW